MLFTLFATATASAITESIITGCGLGVGLYCASRTGKNTYMPRKAK